ncbi:MAG: lysophospholipid acyltransferase family protein [Planctomycetaceae bacterium]|jgi:KDO2-lipid IV(A) lauroyltransferase|nr:lysophospholipid acyltransferase family protein [Planctomycetaceae bacterium]
MKFVIDYFVYLLVRVLFCVVQSLSLKTGHALARKLAWLFTDLIPIRRSLLHENLLTAFPEKTQQERHHLIMLMWEHLFLMGIEIALANRQIRDLNWKSHIHLTGALPLLSLLHQNRPVILVTGHFGNFEIGGFSLGILTYPSNSVARPLDNPFLNRFIKNFRESTGQFLVSKNGGAPDILRVLENNGLMAFLADQSAGPKGCMVDFFGKPASTFKAIALLSLQFKAPIVVCYSLRKINENGDFEPMKFEMNIAGILDPLYLPPDIQNVKEITQWFTLKLEEGIRCHPEQYWWLHRRWKPEKMK